MELTVTESGEISIVHFAGNLDGQSSPAAQAVLSELIGEGATKILVNFEHLSFISSVGLRVLLVAAKQLQHVQGEVRVCNPNAVVMKVFDISGLNMIIQIAMTENEALADF